MARTSRYYQQRGNFGAGILSPSGQENLEADEWLSGATNLDNLIVLRDGGLRGRPALRVGKERYEALRTPRFNSLAGNRFVWNVGRAPELELRRSDGDLFTDAEQDGRFGNDQRNPDWVKPGQSQFNFDAVVKYTPGQGAGRRMEVFRAYLSVGRPQSFTFHGVKLLSGSWLSRGPVVDEQLADPELTFRVYNQGRYHGNPKPPVYDRGVNTGFSLGPVEDPTRNTSNNDGWKIGAFHTGAFAPGRVARDISLPLNELRASAADRLYLRTTPVPGSHLDSYKVSLWIDSEHAAAFQLQIGGVSCFAEDQFITPGDANRLQAEEIDDGVLHWPSGSNGRHPFRLIDWPYRNDAFVLVLGLDRMSLFLLEPGRLPKLRLSQVGERTFTPRQLAELVPSPYGSSLLLAHRDFCYPLRIELPTSGSSQLKVEPIELYNIPVASGVAAHDREISVDTGGGVVTDPTGLVPQNVTVESRLRALRVRWTSVGGGHTYRVRWLLSSAYTANPVALESAASAVVDGTELVIIGLTGGASYSIRVYTVVAGSSDRGSEVVEATTLDLELSVPANLEVEQSEDEDGVLEISWDEVTSAGYTVVYDLQYRFFESRIWTVLQQESGLEDNTLSWDRGSSGGRYEFRVRARAGSAVASGWSEPSEAVQVRNLPPPAPADLTARASGLEGQINLEWRQVLTATSYQVGVQRKVSGQSAPDTDRWVVSGADRNAFTYFGEAGEVYFFRVRSERLNADPSDWTPHVEAEGLEEVEDDDQEMDTPAAVSGLTATAPAGTTGRIALTWNPVSQSAHNGVLSYDVEHRRDSTGSWSEVLGSVTGSSATVSGLLAGASYEFRIRSVFTWRTGSRESGWSAGVAASASGNLVSAPAAPAAPTVTESGTRQISNWNAVAGATGYRWRRRSAPIGTTAWNAWAAQDKGTSLTHRGSVVRGRTYQIQVQAYNATGGSPWSAVVTREVALPPAPTSLAAPVMGTPSETIRGAANFTWSVVSGAGFTSLVSYEAETRLTATDPWTAASNVQDVLRFVDINGTWGQQPWVRVRAFAHNGTEVVYSSWSDPKQLPNGLKMRTDFKYSSTLTSLSFYVLGPRIADHIQVETQYRADDGTVGAWGRATVYPFQRFETKKDGIGIHFLNTAIPGVRGAVRLRARVWDKANDKAAGDWSVSLWTTKSLT